MPVDPAGIRHGAGIVRSIQDSGGEKCETVQSDDRSIREYRHDEGAQRRDVALADERSTTVLDAEGADGQEPPDGRQSSDAPVKEGTRPNR